MNDCIGIIKAVIANLRYNKIINGVHPDHPTKQEYYTAEATKRGLQSPEYEVSTSEKSKIIRSETQLIVKNYLFTTSL